MARSSLARFARLILAPATGAFVVAFLLHNLEEAPARAAALAARERTSAPLVHPLEGASPPSPTVGATFTEGKVTAVTLTAGPFDIHRKYRSMEGPWIHGVFRVGDLVESKAITLPEPMVTYVEDGGKGPAPSMSGGGPVSQGTPGGLVAQPEGKRQLYWFKGIKLEVLDENDNLLPTAEFICHFNLDVDCDERNARFPDAEKCTNTRLASISQGLTQIFLPETFAVPVASDEHWSFSFQAANRTSLQHRRIKHRCTVYFVKDLDLWYPISALDFYVPYIALIVDKNSPDAAWLDVKGCPSCEGTSSGVNAPNNVIGGVYEDKGRVLSGHWVVPPGTHTYFGPVAQREPELGRKRRRIHAAWTHIHPLCEEFSLVHASGATRKKIFTTRVKTSFHDDGFEIEHIDYLSSKVGIEMPRGQYELEVTYVNETGKAIDSMASAGIFTADEVFKRPRWALYDANAVSCGVDTCKAPAMDAPRGKTPLPDFPLFDAATDGPLLTRPCRAELETTSGNIHLLLEPALAPAHATQLARLLASNTYVGTPIFRYERGFIFQVSLATAKADGYASLAAADKALIRRLPLEVAAQADGKLRHVKHVLSAARDDDQPESMVTSFSLVLGDAPHLDGKFTIFGHVVEDDETLTTFDRMAAQWVAKSPPVIRATRLLPGD